MQSIQIPCKMYCVDYSANKLSDTDTDAEDKQ